MALQWWGIGEVGGEVGVIRSDTGLWGVYWKTREQVMGV